VCRKTETESLHIKRFENVLPRYRIVLVKESEDTFTKYPKFQNSRELFESFREELAALDREHFFLITLDSKNRAIGYHTISIGSLSASIVHPREVWKPALLDSAAAVIFLHNHPSGDPAPSREDRDCTNRLVEVSKIIGIRVLDHIVFGETDYYSFADSGMLTDSLNSPA
jgi:DNA repair protein RadC